jgi:hypothetical protein
VRLTHCKHAVYFGERPQANPQWDTGECAPKAPLSRPFARAEHQLNRLLFWRTERGRVSVEPPFTFVV